MISPQEHWIGFKAAFCKALNQVPKPQWEEAWKHVRNKTEFYEWTLMPMVARDLGCRMQVERLRCDYTFFDPSGVPIVVVESENAHQTAWQEMECLCSLAAPLKILMLSCDWENEKQKFLPEWIEIIRKHHASVSVDCLYVIVSGEWESEELPVYSFTPIDRSGCVSAVSRHAVVSGGKANTSSA